MTFGTSTRMNSSMRFSLTNNFNLIVLALTAPKRLRKVRVEWLVLREQARKRVETKGT